MSLADDLTTVRRVGPNEAAACVEALADVLIDCVEGGASVSFMLPLPREKALAFWHSVADGVARGERALLIAEDGAGAILGTVQLILAQPENQPHRAEGKSVLVLDTVTGGDAERLYQRTGWQRVGTVPNYALMPDGAFCGTTFYCRQLAAPAA